MEINQAKKGLFYYSNGQVFEGQYYIDQRGVAREYINEQTQGLALYPRSVIDTEIARSKVRIKGGYATPLPHKPSPDESDYAKGFITRYFVQKKPSMIITEVDSKQFASITDYQTAMHLNSSMYTTLSLKWRLTGAIKKVIIYNKRAILTAYKSMPGIQKMFKSLTEFYKKLPEV